MLTIMVEGLNYGVARRKKAAETVCFCRDSHPFWLSLCKEWAGPQGDSWGLVAIKGCLWSTGTQLLLHLKLEAFSSLRPPDAVAAN